MQVISIFAQPAPAPLPECADATELFGNHKNDQGYFVDQPLPVELPQDLTDPKVSRLCMENPDLVLILSCAPLTNDTRIDKPVLLQQSVLDMDSYAKETVHATHPTYNPGEGDGDGITSADGNGFQPSEFLKNGICFVDRKERDNYVIPNQVEDANLPGACVTVEQGPNEQQTTWKGVKQISQVLQVVADNRVANQQPVNSCTYVVAKRSGGSAIAQGCFKPFRKTFFNAADKSIHVTCP